MSARLGLIIALAVVGVAGLAVGGYAFGRAQAPDEAEATAERQASYESAYNGARERATERSRDRGSEEGRMGGEQSGQRRGSADGDADAEAELADIAAEADQAALSEAEERASNCGAPLFVDGYCPTDAEIAQESQAESLCGPGTAAGREQAAQLGIQC